MLLYDEPLKPSAITIDKTGSLLMFIQTMTKRFVVMLCIVALAAGSISPAFASMIGTEQLLANEQAQAERERLMSTLTRDDVQQQLIVMGVDPNQAVERVNRMTDAEVAALNERIDELPAGAGCAWCCRTDLRSVRHYRRDWCYQHLPVHPPGQLTGATTVASKGGPDHEPSPKRPDRCLAGAHAGTSGLAGLDGRYRRGAGHGAGAAGSGRIAGCSVAW